MAGVFNVKYCWFEGACNSGKSRLAGLLGEVLRLLRVQKGTCNSGSPRLAWVAGGVTGVTRDKKFPRAYIVVKASLTSIFFIIIIIIKEIGVTKGWEVTHGAGIRCYT